MVWGGRFWGIVKNMVGLCGGLGEGNGVGYMGGEEFGVECFV